MGFHSVNLVREKSSSTKLDRLVLLVIASYADDGNLEAHPSYSTIAKGCGISRRSAIKSVANLQRIGELSVKKRPSKPRDSETNVYRITIKTSKEGGERNSLGGEQNSLGW